ncbi:MAG: hypothetical protein Kow0056_12200 [Coriobacteriia bacterium]
MSDGYAPIKGKCVYWREALDEDDRWTPSIKPPKKRVHCSCFVEGDVWTFKAAEVPKDCPNWMACRYYVKYT